jgi:hypothetical protein
MDGTDLTCIDIGAACVAWRRPHLGFSTATVSADGHLFLANDVALYCLDLATGTPAWVQSVTKRMTGREIRALRLSRERVHLIGDRGEGVVITSFDRRTGDHGPSVNCKHLPETRGHDLFASPVLPRTIIGDGQIELQLTEARTIRLPLPVGRYTASQWTADRLLVAGRDLIGIDAKSLPATPTAGLVLTSIPSPTAADAPAEVTLVPGAPIVMLKHPLYGTVRVNRTPTSPPVRVGDKVILEDVTLLPGGVTKVAAWHLASTFSAPSQTVLTADSLPPRDAFPALEEAFFSR